MSELNQGTWAENVSSAEGGKETAAPRQIEQITEKNESIGREKKVGKTETEETKRMKENFGFFGPVSFLFAVFYAFCMFRNGSGVTFPFFAAASLLFMHLSLTKLGTTLKKGSGFYMAAIMLLGVSTFCTDDSRIIFFNKLGIFLLMMSLLLKQYFDTSKWGLGKFLGSICQLTFSSMGEAGRPFRDASEYRRKRTGKDDKRIWAVGIGLLIGVPLVLAVLLLLSSADALFRQLTSKFVENINFANIMNVLFRVAFMFLAAYCLTSYLCRKQIKEEVKDHRTGEPVMAITVTSMLTVLYLVFSVIQVVGLFMGKMQLPDGYSYASYAREGFFQLLAVSFLNLVIVLVSLSFFRESKALRIILTIMSLCTFIMIASSAMRMIIYIRYYYLTFLRVLVLWALGLLTVLFIGVVINIYRESFPLFRYSVAVVTVLYLALSFAHPDYIIAKVNVANTPEMEQSSFGAGESYEDYRYLSYLSADAAPALVPYLEKLGYDMETFYEDYPVKYMKAIIIDWGGRRSSDTFGYYWMEDMQSRTENFGIRTFNVSRYRLLKLLEEAAE